MKGFEFMSNTFRQFIAINEIFSRQQWRSILLDWPNGVHLKLACFSGKFLFENELAWIDIFFFKFSFVCHRFKLLLNSNNLNEEGDSEAVIKTKAFEKGVLALPGTVFLPNGTKTAYVRASFSLTEEKDVDMAIQRLRDVILDSRMVSG